MKLDITNGNLKWKSDARIKNIKKIINGLKKTNSSENLINLLEELKKYNENQKHSFPKNYTFKQINDTLKWEGHKDKLNLPHTLHNHPPMDDIPSKK